MKRAAVAPVVLVIACVALTAAATLAADRNWALLATGAWNAAENWDTAIPASGDIAYIDNSGTASLPTGVTGTASALFVGNTSSGALEIAGGTLAGIAASVGNSVGATGTATLSGPGSEWNLDSFLVVGSSGTGGIDISDGAMLCNYDYGWLAAQSGSVGTVTIDGQDSLWQSSLLSVGLRGLGTLSITGGAEMICYYADVGLYAGSDGTLSVDGAGSAFTDTGNLAVGVGGAGKLRLTNGGAAYISGALAVGAPGTIEGDGQIYGNVSNGGLVSPGMSPGALAVTGDFTQTAAGKLQIELGGTTPGQSYDQLLVSGSLTLGGTLEVSLIDGFAPALGDEFTVLGFSSQSGTFATLDLPALTGGLGWDTTRLYSEGILAALAGDGDLNDDNLVNADDIDILWRVVRGGEDDPGGDDVEDFNDDGRVNEDDVDYLLANLLTAGPGRSYGDADLDGGVGGLDYTAWRQRAGTGWANGDFDGDGGVGGLDYTLWRTRPTAFPTTVGPHGGSLMAVPEPSGLVLAALSLPALFLLVRSPVRRTI